MDIIYEVDWFKECYPFPDDCGKLIFTDKTKAIDFQDEKAAQGCATLLTIKHIDPDEE